MVVPKGVVAPLCFGGGGIDTHVVVGSTHHHLFTPVAKEVGLQTGGTFGVVVGHRTREGGNGSLTIFIYGTLGILAIGIVEALLAEVTIPVKSHVVGKSRSGGTFQCLTGDTTDKPGVSCRKSLCTREVVREVAHGTTAVVIACAIAVENLSCSGIAQVISRMVFIASKELLSVAIGVKVAHMLRVSMSQACGGKSFTIVVDGH